MFNLLAQHLSRIRFNIFIPSVPTFSQTIPWYFSANIWYEILVLHKHGTCTIHFIHIHLITTIIIIAEVYLNYFVSLRVTTSTPTLLSFPAAKYFLNTLSSSIFNLHYSVRFSFCTSHSYKRGDRIIILMPWSSDLTWETAK